MTKQLKVSVVIPMYNASSHIASCLISVYQQTYSNLEVIIVDDGSTDDSYVIATSVSSKYPLVPTVMVQKPNGGVSSARNAGLKKVTGDYIAFLDADDEWFEDKIQFQMNIFNQHPEIEFLACNPIQDQITRFFLKKFEWLNPIKVGDLIYKNYFQPSTVIFKSNIVADIGYFDETQRYAEEGNYFMRIANKYNCVLVNNRMIYYGKGKKGFGDSGLSANVKEMEKGELKNLKFAYKQGYINIIQYFSALIFSLTKYMIRLTRVSIKR